MLAEQIANDETNQYFITTHSPYLLASLMEKVPIENLNVFATYNKKGVTKISKFSEEEISEAMDLGSNVFFNLEKFIPEDISEES